MGGYVALRLLTHRLAQRQPDVRTFVIVEMGGLVGRMMLVLGGAALVLVLLPVDPNAFVGTVLSLLVLSVGVETVLVVRRLS